MNSCETNRTYVQLTGIYLSDLHLRKPLTMVSIMNMNISIRDRSYLKSRQKSLSEVYAFFYLSEQYEIYTVYTYSRMDPLISCRDQYNKIWWNIAYACKSITFTRVLSAM